ncbi:hypothetical protein H8959_018599 [Pygathrix nigripes]
MGDIIPIKKNREPEIEINFSKVIRNSYTKPTQRQLFLILFQRKIMGSQSNLSDEIEEQTLGKIQELNGHYNKHMESVMNQLLSMVCDMKPEIHVNYRATN